MGGRITATALAVALLGACASEVRRQPVEIAVAGPEAGRRFGLRDSVAFKLDSGYARTMPAGTLFAVVGRVAQGLVLKPADTILTVEGRHMHEAYAVLRDDLLVGFYLPVEKAFSPLSHPVAFPLAERKP